jgi:hypothetical protein
VRQTRKRQSVRHVKEIDNKRHMRHTLRQMKKADMRQIMRQIMKKHKLSNMHETETEDTEYCRMIKAS